MEVQTLMKLSVGESDGIPVVELKGEFTATHAAQVRRACNEQVEKGRRRLIIDFTGSTRVDGVSLACLLSVLSKLRAAGGDLALVGVNPDLRKRLERTHMDKVFKTYREVHQAVEKLEEKKS